MIFIVVAAVCILLFFKYRKYALSMKNDTTADKHTELARTMDGLSTISALQEGVIVEQGKTIEKLKSEMNELKRTFSEMSKE